MSETGDSVVEVPQSQETNGNKVTDSDVPIIIANELVSNSDKQESKSCSHESKMDELNSLEREIAELHHVEPSTPSIAQKVHEVHVGTFMNDDYPNSGDKVILEMQPPQCRNSTPAAEDKNGMDNNGSVQGVHKEVVETLEDEDLIAVLKGDESDQKIDDNSIAGVTIEGEGEFQIMEIDDDEPDEGETINSFQSTDKVSSFGKSVALLTKEEERHLALEQMKGLHIERQRQRQRKQDIKPIQVETPDLVSMLGADWSDDDATVDLPEKVGDTKSIATAPQIPQVASTSIATSEKPTQEKSKQRKSPPKITSVVVLKSGSVSGQSISAPTNTAPLESEKEKREKETVTAPAPVSGFKRTRIIKRKIIWDPDAPETQFSYATLVRPSNNSPTTSAKVKTEPIKTTAVATNKTTAASAVSHLKKEPVQKKIRPSTPKERNMPINTESSKSSDRAATPKLQVKPSTSGAVLTKQSKTLDDPTPTASPVKRRSQTPVANSGNKKKKNNELDRLMGDEGAVNMLTALEIERQKAAEVSELPKPNMRSRSATISEKFNKRDLTPVKKETQAAPKQKRGPKPKASSTWDYVYKQKAAEDSMIIRRRSNSSYSSTASLHRLSLDAPTSSSTAKNTQKSTQKRKLSSTNTPVTSSTPPTSSANKSSPKTPNSTPNTSLGGTSIKSLNASVNSISSSPTGKTFEFAKPESKSNQKTRKSKSPQVTDPLASDMKKAATVGNRRSGSVRSPSTVEDKEKSTNKPSSQISKDDTANSVVIKRLGQVAQLIFSTSKSRVDYTFNIEILNSIVDTLNKLSTDNECNVVVMTTSAPNFCQGIDYTDLTLGSLEERKKAAKLLGTAAKNLLKTLATFPKPLIAGVNGSNIGLGVMILPLFDIVIASDKGSYDAPYAKIGQVPEGYCIWNELSKIRGTFKTKLFWLCEKLHSTESALSGLVNKLTAPSKVNEDALATAKKIAAMSCESYHTMKQTTIESNADVISIKLEKEFETIIEQWTSESCFENFKKYFETGHW